MFLVLLFKVPRTHTHLIKAGDDLIQKSEAVHPLMFDLFLLKVLIEAGDGGKHDTDLIIGLGVKLLKRALCHTLSS